MDSILSDSPEVRAQQTADANVAKTFAEDFKWLMSSPRGRRIVWWLLSKANIYGSSFHTSGSITAFNEGRRSLGLEVLGSVHLHAADRYMEMVKEQETK